MPSNRVPADDITPRISDELLAEAFCASPVAMSITRLNDGRFLEVNDRFLSLYGYSREDVIGATALELGMWSDPEDRADMVRAVQEEGLVQREVNFLTRAGEIRVNLFSAQRLHIEGEEFLVTVATDITERKRTEESLRHLATRDELTGLYNRREMGFLLQAELARSRRYNHFLSMMIIDLDRFKVVNDTYGHQVGDEVLREVARLVQENIRAGDSAARYGGEELAVILPETTASGAFKVAERIRQAVAAHPFARPQGGTRTLPVRMTISTGIGCFPGDGDSQDALIVAADRALYNAKEEGRNRTIMYSGSRFGTQPLNSHPVED
ncbi:MAG: sensor domain-containing diguanylate cyclase [Chloroflexota bacterium]|nr:sensor domain-containing diguanylate cyclase [Chloroflexota bacterium]MDQ5865091.1 sensor domain-containing diguanylate cyclase [Chloroflexota bacterium]